MFVGFHTTFLVQHWLGNEGMPRRYAEYQAQDGFTTLNTVSTVGSFILGASTLFFMWNVWKTWRYGRIVTVNDPWGFGNSLEWATSCPPPLRNFDQLPRIRSERPAFDIKYGSLVSDLGRDLPQRETVPPQEFREELHHERRGPEFASGTGARGAAGAADFRPPPESGARPVDVPEPDSIRRTGFTDPQPEERHSGIDETRARGGRENERWRSGRRSDEDDDEGGRSARRKR
jgi:cytochrome c oxidase subunit 1